MTAKEALESLKFEVYEEGHCSYIEEEIGVAVAALEKQVPKPPVKDGTGLAFNLLCPVCRKRIISQVYGEWCAGRLQEYCDYCGQAIDWGDWE